MSTSRTQNRRRRVVFDEAIQKAARSVAASGEGGSGGKRPVRKRKYSSQARQSRRLADFIPKRWLTMASITLLALLGLTSLNVLDWTSELAPLQNNRYWHAAFSFESPQGLAPWCQTACGLAAAGYACLIYGLRRHRRDDYRGTYRIWLLLVGWAMLMSLQVSLELDRALLGVLHYYVPRDWLHPDVTWVGWLRLGILSAVAFRVLVEIRHSKLSVLYLSAAWLAVGVAILVGQPETQAWGWSELTWLSPNGFLVAAIGMWLTTVSYSRFVYMDVFGLRAKYVAERTARREASRRRQAAKRRAAEDKQRARQEAQASERSVQTAPAAGAAGEPKSATATGAASSNNPKPTSAAATPASRLGPLASRLKFGSGGAAPVGNANSASSNAGAKTAAVTANSAGASTSSAAVREDSAARLSKSERKRLKKLQGQDRRAA